MWIDAWPAVSEEWWDGLREGPIAPLNNVSFIPLSRPPLVSVNSVHSFDNTDTPTVWPSSNYFVDTARQPGRLALRLGATWPIPTRLSNGICIEYIAGYGSSSASVPEVINTAIRQLVTHWYEHRGEASLTGGSTRSSTAYNAINVPMVIQALLDPYRIRTAH